MIRVLLCLVIFMLSKLKAQDALKEKAWKGDTTAIMQLVENYLIGLNNYPQNLDSAKTFLWLGVEKKHPDALYLAGVAYIRGTMYPQNLNKGIQFLEQSLQSGNAQAYVVLFELFANPDTSLFAVQTIKRDSSRALKYAHQAAQKQQSWAMYELGKAYYYGSGISKNDSLAVHWLDQAALRYHVKAQLLLGDWFFKGCTALGPDLLKSRYYYQLAEKNPYADIEDQTWGLVGVYNTYQIYKEFWNTASFIWYAFTFEDLRMPWDGNSQKFMLDREKYIREMEASQQKKIQEYQKKLKEREKYMQELLQEYGKKIRREISPVKD